MENVHFNNIDVFLIFRGTMIGRNAGEVIAEIKAEYPALLCEGFNSDIIFTWKLSGEYSGTMTEMKRKYGEIAKKLLIKKFTLDFISKFANISGIMKWKFPKQRHVLRIDGAVAPDKMFAVLHDIFDKTKFIKCGGENKYMAICVKYRFDNEIGNEIEKLFSIYNDFSVVYDAVETIVSGKKNYSVNVHDKR